MTQISLIAAIASGATPLLVYLFRRQKRSGRTDESLKLNPNQDPAGSIDSLLGYIAQSAYSIESDVVTLKAKVDALADVQRKAGMRADEQKKSEANELELEPDDPIQRKSEVKKK